MAKASFLIRGYLVAIVVMWKTARLINKHGKALGLTKKQRQDAWLIATRQAVTDALFKWRFRFDNPYSELNAICEREVWLQQFRV